MSDRDAGPTVRALELTKSFGETKALKAVSFEVAKGELFGFIGPDGGGKTTLFRILTTLLVPDSGSATVLGLNVVKDLWALRQLVGYMPGRFSLYPDLSVEENLRFFASVFGTTPEEGYKHIAPIYDQIKPFASRRAGALSGGMKQKLALSCALVHHPDILFLDEPTTGVDAVSRREFWELLANLKKTGLTIVVSTPYMDEARRCDRIALIQNGSLLAIDTPERIAKSVDARLFAVRASERYKLLQTLRRFPHARTVYPFGEVLHYTDDRRDASAQTIAGEVTAFLQREGLKEVLVEPTEATVEDAFIERMVHA